jgi:hypothetical protein
MGGTARVGVVMSCLKSYGFEHLHLGKNKEAWQVAERLLDRGPPCTGMHGRPEPGWSVQQGCIVAP